MRSNELAGFESRRIPDACFASGSGVGLQAPASVQLAHAQVEVPPRDDASCGRDQPSTVETVAVMAACLVLCAVVWWVDSVATRREDAELMHLGVDDASLRGRARRHGR